MDSTVFICHSARDKQIADAACSALEAQRIPCWIAPRDVLAGEEWGKSIIDALTGCSIVLLIFSGHANDSPQVRREIERAVSKGKIIVPFRIEDVLPSDAMEYALGNTHWLNALTPPMESRMSELCETVSRLMKRQHPAEPLWQAESSDFEQTDRGDETVVRPIAAKPTVAEVKPNAAGRGPAERAAVAGGATHGGGGAEAVAPPPRPAFYNAAAAPPKAASKGKAWMWGGGIAAVVAVVILIIVAVSSGSSNAPVRDVAASPGPATSAVEPAPITVETPRQGASVAEMEMQEQELYREQNFGSAFPLAKAACDGGVAAACNHAGVMYARGRGTAQDEVEAVALYRKACDGGEAGGCTNLAYMYQNGKGVGEDPEQARVFYTKGCDGHYAIGCTALGEIYENGKGVPVDLAQAAAFYQKGCDGGNAIGCAGLRSMNSGGRESVRRGFRR